VRAVTYIRLRCAALAAPMERGCPCASNGGRRVGAAASHLAGRATPMDVIVELQRSPWRLPMGSPCGRPTLLHRGADPDTALVALAQRSLGPPQLWAAVQLDRDRVQHYDTTGGRSSGRSHVRVPRPVVWIGGRPMREDGAPAACEAIAGARRLVAFPTITSSRGRAPARTGSAPLGRVLEAQGNFPFGAGGRRAIRRMRSVTARHQFAEVGLSFSERRRWPATNDASGRWPPVRVRSGPDLARSARGLGQLSAHWADQFCRSVGVGVVEGVIGCAGPGVVGALVERGTFAEGIHLRERKGALGVADAGERLLPSSARAAEQEPRARSTRD